MSCRQIFPSFSSHPYWKRLGSMGAGSAAFSHIKEVLGHITVIGPQTSNFQNGFIIFFHFGLKEHILRFIYLWLFSC